MHQHGEATVFDEVSVRLVGEMVSQVPSLDAVAEYSQRLIGKWFRSSGRRYVRCCSCRMLGVGWVDAQVGT